MNKYSKKIKEYIDFYRYIKPFGINTLKSKETKDIAVFASPRGGSTWLAQTLQTLTNGALVWEPLFRYNQYKINVLNPFAYPERYQYPLWWNQYIPEDADFEMAKTFFDKLLNKEIINLKLHRFNDFSTIQNAPTFIYKFCFGNRLLPWFAKNYAHKNPVFLMRHPCAVVSSQLKYGAWDWHKKNPQMNLNMPFYPEFYEPYKDVLSEIKTVEEKLAAEWALNIIVPAKNRNNDKCWVTIAYEDMKQNPIEALRKIKLRYGFSWDDSEALKIVNKQSFTKSSYKSGNSALDSWKQHLTTEQIDRILNITHALGVDFYNENPDPDYSKIYAE